MITKIIIYATLLVASAILIFSTARIGKVIYSSEISNIISGGITDTSYDDTDQKILTVYSSSNNDDDNGSSNKNGDEPPILPINQRKLAVKNELTGSDGVSDVLPRLYELPRRTIDPSKLPYKCGVVLIQHGTSDDISSTVDQWIRGLIDTNDDSGATYISSVDVGSKEAFMSQIDEQINLKGQFYWTVLHSQEHGLALASDENILHRLRENMEVRGCHLAAISIFSEPLTFSMQQTRNMFSEQCNKKKNCNVSEFTKTLESDASHGSWRGQLDYFLYNTGKVMESDPKVKVKDAMNKLREHYDLVLLDSKDDFTKEILKITGWKSPDGEFETAETRSMEIGELRYSKPMVKQYTKFDAKNGDADFYDALNHVYYNDLAFLFNQ